MVDDMVQSKKYTSLRLLFLEMLFRCSLFRLKELIKVKKVKLRPVPFWGVGGNAKKLISRTTLNGGKKGMVLGTCQKLAGRGGGNFKFGFGNEVTHPCNGSEIC